MRVCIVAVLICGALEQESCFHLCWQWSYGAPKGTWGKKKSMRFCKIRIARSEYSLRQERPSMLSTLFRSPIYLEAMSRAKKWFTILILYVRPIQKHNSNVPWVMRKVHLLCLFCFRLLTQKHTALKKKDFQKCILPHPPIIFFPPRVPSGAP